MGKKTKTAEEVVIDVEVEQAEAPKKKKKKTKTTEAVVVEEVAETPAPAVEEPEKKKKKKKKAAVVEEAVAEKAAEEEEKPAKKAKKENSDSDDDVEMSPASTAATEGKGVEKEAEEEEGLSLFIGNLSFKATIEQVEKDFGECGELDNFHMPLNEEGRPKGIAFVTYKTAAGVKKAMEYHEQDYYGRALRVEKRESGGKKGGKGKGKDGKKGGKMQVRSEKPENCLSVIVKNLGFAETEDSLWEHFKEVEPKQVKLCTDRETGQSRGFAFIDFADTETVDKAIEKFGDAEIGGRKIFMDYNGPREKGEKGKGKDGKGKGKGKDGKGKGKGKGKKGKGKESDPARDRASGAIQEFKGTVTAFNDSDSD